VQAGSQLVERSGSTMTEIVNSISRVSSIMGEIAAAALEQSTGIDQVNLAVAQMDEVTQQNAALVEQAAAAASSLEEQARRLTSAVAVFQTGSGDSSFAGRQGGAAAAQRKVKAGEFVAA
jgi:methyl-accepting chemotaxis protein I, serine sensor receptor